MIDTGKNKEEFYDDEIDVVNIPDESGKEVPFEIVKVIRFEDKDYAILHPLEHYKGLDDDSCAICEMVMDADGESVNLIPEDDDDICDSVYALYVEWATMQGSCSGNCEGCSGCDDPDDPEDK
ncbi:MAG: DUF1292 domain-containing protein [Clostridia bacterium]|nr:DUF1292 domain-containing protein [Clostridia bacterium]